MRRRALLSQVLALNVALVCLVALGAALLARLDLGKPGLVALIVAGSAAVGFAVNLTFLRRRLSHLERLIDDMERVDLSMPRANVPASIDGRGESEEVERIELAFLRMLRRLEAERHRASRAALRAQEEERARVARDLHDEVNQSLTGVLLRLQAAQEKAPAELDAELAETKRLANQAMEELLALARQLRPTALDDLGLQAALAGQVKELSRGGALEASFDAKGDLSALAADDQLVIYRVAQEALSNAQRHSGATKVRAALSADGGGVELEVVDDGSGFSFAEAEGGLGIAGMRERALLVGGDLAIESRPGRGTRVRLRIPARPQ